MKRGKPSRRHPTPILILLFAAGTAVAAASQAASWLETGPGALRIWDSARESVEIAVGEGRIARAATAAEGGHVVAGEDLVAADLFFLLAERGGIRELPLPPHAGRLEGGVAARARPVLLTRGDRLDGAVWLEAAGSGASTVGGSVRAAVWNGTSWERVETVSPANGRPQLAPAAAVLADGSWLVVWAGFDGGDDEIFWSRRRDGVWSRPRRVHRDNKVPDVLPALTADGDGALAAWSFYDGNDYRARTARFAGGEWSVGVPLDGLGASDVAWQRRAERSFVVFRTVVPEAWTVVELGLLDGIRHVVTVEKADERPPLVEAGAGFAPPRLVWPYRDGRPRR